jgi:hypothetical protein
MARKLRVGFVGLGRVFDLNVRGYLDHAEAEVSALCDADPAILARRAGEHPGARATHDFQDFLGSDLDLIEILTPHPLHEAMTVAALADTCEPVAHVSEEPKRDRHHVVAVVEHHRAAAAIGSKLVAPAARPIRHGPGLRAIGHYHLHSEMERPADRALTEQLAGSDQWWVENKVLEHL